MGIEDVDSWLTQKRVTVDEAIGSFQVLHSKYKFMESHQLKNKTNIKAKLPEIKKTLNAVKFLKEKKEKNEELSAHFSLADNLYAKAHVLPENKVCLWLGANVMLEYTY